ncbi:ribonuclease J1 [Bacillus horti]|uniref:Ribonuclease J n=1 Tax=Caldalkalibacillus horti TaxID=77523 RepID=A0ABT9W4B5_9BACI|nr:ribonuclease J [Bacillus horti]MDQ0168086.1 ribonuclease J [Bacillus horti]
MKKDQVNIFALGGLDEIGKNMYGIQYKDEIIIIDSGLKFPEEDMPGIDLIIPDVSYLVENLSKVKGIFLTHGHEDHIGGLPYILKQIQVPLYGEKLTLGLVRAKLEEHGLLRSSKLIPFSNQDTVKFNHLSVSCFRTNHSIPDSIGIVVRTPEGPVVHTGDFKFDFSPPGHGTDYAKLAALGEEGVLALLSDSTNSERSGYTGSEQKVGASLIEVFQKAEGRILFATFASNVYRLQQVVEAATHHDRKIAVFGRSMEKVFQIGQELGYIRLPKGMLVEGDQINRIPDDKLVIICTGSQGESMAVLARIARGAHRQIQLNPGDTVVFSSSPIPGNALNVNRIIDQLFRMGADVIYGKSFDIHASGHGSQEDMKLMLQFLKPKYFIPIHGEYRMLAKHREIAAEVGVPLENSFLMENGDVLHLTQKEGYVGDKIPSGALLVDGHGIGDVGNIVLRDRMKLSDDGLIVIVTTIDMKNFKVLSGPDVISRGFIFVRESADLIKETEAKIKALMEDLMNQKVRSWSNIKSQIIDTVAPFIYKKIQRRPMIIPIIMEVNEEDIRSNNQERSTNIL